MKKIIVVIMCMLVFLVGCGSEDTVATLEVEEVEEEVEEVEEEVVIEYPMGTITVATTGVPYTEILEQAKVMLAEDGWGLEILEYEDYAEPNQAVENGEADCNFYQHTLYLDMYNEQFESNLVNVAGIYYVPLGIYAGTAFNLDEIPEDAVIVIPDDVVNTARALLLLQDNGLITLLENVGITASVNDIMGNPYGIEIIEVDSSTIPTQLEEVSFGIMNGNYALQAQMDPVEEAPLVIENKEAEAIQSYVNILVTKEGKEEDQGVLTLLETLQSSEMETWMMETYQGALLVY